MGNKVDEKFRSDLSAKSAIRTCLGCRKTGLRSELLRLVASSDNQLLVDKAKKAGGRGAWVHIECSGRLRVGVVRFALRNPGLLPERENKELLSVPFGSDR